MRFGVLPHFLEYCKHVSVPHSLVLWSKGSRNLSAFSPQEIQHTQKLLERSAVCSAQITPPIQAQTPMQPQRPTALSSAPTPMPASTPLPHVGGPLTPFPAPAEPRSDDEVAEQWSRGMAMLHDEDLAQVSATPLQCCPIPHCGTAHGRNPCQEPTVCNDHMPKCCCSHQSNGASLLHADAVNFAFW